MASGSQPHEVLEVAEELDDLTLRRARKGDEAACRELVRCYQGPVTTFLGRVVGTSGASSAVEDLAHETFLRLFQRLRDLAVPQDGRLSRVLFEIAAEVATGASTRRRRASLRRDGGVAPAPLIPDGFVDRVLASRSGAPDGTGELGTARSWGRARWRFALAVVGVALAAGVVVTLSLWRTSGVPLTASRVTRARETIQLSARGVAVAEAGAELRWEVSADGDVRMEQIQGDLFYRITPGRHFVVVTPHGTLAAVGTCFRVVVPGPLSGTTQAPPTSQARGAVAPGPVQARDAAAPGPVQGYGTAAPGPVQVHVYEGRILAATEAGSLRLQAGEGALLMRRRPPARVVASGTAPGSAPAPAPSAGSARPLGAAVGSPPAASSPHLSR